jgi:thioesterase domain-containing protein
MMPHAPFDEQRALSADELRRRSPQDRLAYLAEAAHQANYRLTADNSEGDTSRLERYLRIYKSHGRATASYRPQVYPGRITFFQAESIVRADFRAAVQKGDASSSWRDWSLQPLTVYSVPGEHDALMDEPYVGVLAEKLAASISALEPDML